MAWSSRFVTSRSGRFILGSFRSFSSKKTGQRPKIDSWKRSLFGATAAAFTGFGIASYWNKQRVAGDSFSLTLASTAYAASPVAQDNVVSQTKNHALYLWIHLKPDANLKLCARSVANIQKLVDAVNPPDLRDESDEIWVGVGFGSKLYSSLGKNPPSKYDYQARKGNLGDLPSTGGDIFVHAKSNSLGNLFDLCQQLQKQLPPGSIEKFSDTYGFVYRNGRDLSGFIDGTENPADDEKRSTVALNSTGGSFCVTQKWIHQHDTISGQKSKIAKVCLVADTLEGWIGRSFPDSTELKNKPVTSHVARMTSGPEVGAKKPFEIVRQSMPFGSVAGDSGLFFIAFAASPNNFEYMLDRMTGAANDGDCDDVMRLSKCVEGTYWYFPSKDELKSLAS